jgi:hypothetical protein
MQAGGYSLVLALDIYEEYNFLCRNFVEVGFAHCPRKSNMVADTLDRHTEGPMLVILFL